MNQSIFRILGFSLLLLTASSCRKIFGGIDGTITYKGRILRDCSGTPLAFQTVDISFKPDYNPFNSNKEVADEHTTTDQYGNFCITVPHPGAGKIQLWHDLGTNHPYLFVDDYGVTYTKPGDTIDLHTIYMNDLWKYCVVNIHLGNTRSDTLYFGTGSSTYKTIYPVKKGQSTVFTFAEPLTPSSLQYQDSFLFAKAYSKKSYDSLLLARAKQYYTVVYGHLCAPKDTTDITIE